MAIRISATTDRDRQLLQAMRDSAWKSRIDVSQFIREALLQKVYGTRQHWPEEFK